MRSLPTIFLFLGVHFAAEFVQCELAVRDNGSSASQLTEKLANSLSEKGVDPVGEGALPHDKNAGHGDSGDSMEDENEGEDEEDDDELLDDSDNEDEDENDSDEEDDEDLDDNDDEDDSDDDDEAGPPYSEVTPGVNNIILDVAVAEFGVPQLLGSGNEYEAILDKIDEARAYIEDFINLDSAFRPVRKLCKNKHELCALWATVGGECQNVSLERPRWLHDNSYNSSIFVADNQSVVVRSVQALSPIFSSLLSDKCRMRREPNLHEKKLCSCL